MTTSTPSHELVTLKNALFQRVQAVWPYLTKQLMTGNSVDDIPRMTQHLAAEVRNSNLSSHAWLLLIALTGRYPDSEDVREFLGRLKSSPFTHLFLGALKGALIPAYTGKSMSSQIEILHRVTVVDVNFCATNGHNTGIQRVVRETVSRWARNSDVNLVAWTPEATGMRRLSEEEELRVIEWTSEKRHEHTHPDEVDSERIIVPWNSRVLMPEVISEITCKPWSSLAEFSGNFTGVIGYDAIPITSSEAVPPHESDRFVHYLSAVKFTDKVAGISGSASNEFNGFNKMLSAQGLSGPTVGTISLANQKVARKAPQLLRGQDTQLPLVLSVGTQEPRKNQLSTVAAAELLWKEGMEFELVFVGNAAVPLSDPFDRAVQFAQEVNKRQIRVLRHASDTELAGLYDTALFSIFVSLHEGYGLPVVESLAHGCPVIASNYGSVGEIAGTGGGCVLVDPRDISAIADAMKEMIVSSELRSTLTNQAMKRPEKTWDTYSQELWDFFDISGTSNA